MRVFIAGATGVLGRRVVRQLVTAGHTVSGLSRSDANAAWLAAQDAHPLTGDLFNAQHMRDLVAGHDAVLHLATAIPTGARSSVADWATNDRIRREGTANLIDAAITNSCSLYVQQSITFLYGDHGADWVDEDTPLPQTLSPVLVSAGEMEHMVAVAAQTADLPFVNLRFGMFYSADSAQTQAILENARRGMFPILGDGRAYWSLIHADDAASAVVSVVDRPAAAIGGTFNVCDDEPVMMGDLAKAVAGMLGARSPRRVPAALARLMLGSGTTAALMTSTRCRNERFRAALDWSPRFPTYLEGYRATVDEWLAT